MNFFLIPYFIWESLAFSNFEVPSDCESLRPRILHPRQWEHTIHIYRTFQFYFVFSFSFPSFVIWENFILNATFFLNVSFHFSWTFSTLTYAYGLHTYILYAYITSFDEIIWCLMVARWDECKITFARRSVVRLRLVDECGVGGWLTEAVAATAADYVLRTRVVKDS